MSIDVQNLRDLMNKAVHSKVKYRFDPRDEWQEGRCVFVQAKTQFGKLDFTIRVCEDLDGEEADYSVPFSPTWVQFEGIEPKAESSLEYELASNQFMDRVARYYDEGDITEEEYNNALRINFAKAHAGEELSPDELKSELEDFDPSDVQGRDSDSDSQRKEGKEVEFALDVAFIIRTESGNWVGLDPCLEKATDEYTQKSELQDEIGSKSTKRYGDGFYFVVPKELDVEVEKVREAVS